MGPFQRTPARHPLYRHKFAGYEPPTSATRHPHLGAVAQARTQPAADVLIAMLSLCPDTLAGKRDRALLALGFAGAFRRSELVAPWARGYRPARASLQARADNPPGDEPN